MGKHYLFEATVSGEIWDIHEVHEFCKRWNSLQIDMEASAIGLKDKDKISQKIFGKRWQIMTSSLAVTMMQKQLICSKDHEHETVEVFSGGQLRSVQ